MNITAAALGPQELLIILVIVLVLFGGAKLPQLARSLGEAKREFEKSANDTASATPNESSSKESSPNDTSA